MWKVLLLAALMTMLAKGQTQVNFYHAISPLVAAPGSFQALVRIDNPGVQWIDLHFRAGSDAQMNVRMRPVAASGGQYEFSPIALAQGAKLLYSFTAMISGAAYDSPVYEFSERVFSAKIVAVDVQAGTYKIVFTANQGVSWVDLHMAVNSMPMLNYRLNQGTQANTFEFPLSGIQSGTTIRYWFTFLTANQGAVDTDQFTFVAGVSNVDSSTTSNVQPTQPIPNPNPIQQQQQQPGQPTTGSQPTFPGQQPQQPGVQGTQPIETQVNPLPDAGYEIVLISNQATVPTWVDVHYRINQGMTLNYRLEPISPRRFVHRRVLLNANDVLSYSFTYADNSGLATDTQVFEFRATAGGNNGPLPSSPNQPGQPGQGPNGQPQFPSGPSLPGQQPQPQGQPQGQGQGPFPQIQQPIPAQPQGPVFGSTGGVPQLPIGAATGLTGPGLTGLTGPSPLPNAPTGIAPSPSPSPSSTTCQATDYECQLRTACANCFSNPGLAQCVPCISLASCTTTNCQINAVCSLCSALPTSARPPICGLLTGCPTA